MLLTRETEIAIAMLVACAHAGNRRLQTREAAAETGASKAHASKVAYLLRRAGLVTSMRGRYGGIKLAMPARSISLGAVLRNMQPKQIPALQRRSNGLTQLDTVIEDSWLSFALLMDRLTIEDLLARRGPSPVACHNCRFLPPQTASTPALAIQ